MTLKVLIKIGIFAFLILPIASMVTAQDKNIAIGLKGSTMGYGGDVIFQFHEKMSVRLGYDQLTSNFSYDFDESDISFTADANIKTGSITALYDYYLTNSIFISGGFGINNFNINTKGKPNKGMPWGDITIPIDKIGEFEFDVKPNMKISPYLGIGFGRTIGKLKNFGAAFEMGAYYQGSPKLTATTTGLLTPTSDPDYRQEQVLEGQISQYSFYPILKLSLSYKIMSF